MRGLGLLWLGLLPACVTGPADEVDLGPAAVCETAHAPRQLRLLNRREYDATVRDLLDLDIARSCTDDHECALDLQSCVDSTCTADSCDVVTFLLPWGGASHIAVAGTFNDWNPEAPGWGMSKVPGSDLWYLKHGLSADEHSYKFVVDGTQWLHDAANPWTTDDTFGGFNSVVAVRCDASELTADPNRPSSRMPLESRPQGWAYDNHVASGLVTSVHLEAYLDAAAELAAATDLTTLAGCDGTATSCIEGFVARFGKRAFRRPLEPAEVSRYATLAASASDPTDALRLALEGLLSSPHFLYRSEMGRAEQGGYRLDSYETASAISYFLWGTMPDTELLTAADRGELATAAQLEAQARRMLADPKARDTAATFATQWLGIERTLTADKRTDEFSAFTVAARTSAVRATQRLYTDLLFGEEGTFQELLTSDSHYVDTHLAPLYGSGDGPADLTRVEMPRADRPGVLGELSVLAATAYSDQTSPVRRGLFVRERLLCQHLGTPPANAGGVPDVDPDATTRERFDQHSSDGSCAVCHRYIDPVGYGFEHFDPIGAWRDQDAGRPIDATGVMFDLERDGGGDIPFASLGELADLIAGSQSAPRCFARELYRFAVGFEEAEDDCAITELTERFAAANHDIEELMIAIVTSPTFTARKGEVP